MASNKSDSIQNLPLSGIRILDFTRLYPGPLGTMMLAEMGAEVIRIEDPEKPDHMRLLPPFIDGESAGFLAVNRSKKSISLRLREQKAREIFFELVKISDIVVEQFRPGYMESIGIGHDEISKINEKIIYISLTGYGQNSPYSLDGGHDLNYIGLAGVLDAPTPYIPAPQIADVAGGAYMLMIACLAAIIHREHTQKGRKIVLSMLDGVLPLMTLQMAHHWAAADQLAGNLPPLSGGLASYNIYICSDGKYIALAILELGTWNRFCDFLEKPGWKNRLFDYGKDAVELKEKISLIFAKKNRDEWIRETQHLDICLTPVLETGEVEDNPHFRSGGMIFEYHHPSCGEKKIKGIANPLNFSENIDEIPFFRPAPTPGQDTVDILHELGYSDTDIAGFSSDGIIP